MKTVKNIFFKVVDEDMPFILFVSAMLGLWYWVTKAIFAIGLAFSIPF